MVYVKVLAICLAWLLYENIDLFLEAYKSLSFMLNWAS